MRDLNDEDAVYSARRLGWRSLRAVLYALLDEDESVDSFVERSTRTHARRPIERSSQ